MRRALLPLLLVLHSAALHAPLGPRRGAASALHAPSISRHRCGLRASPREVVDAFTSPSGAAATAIFCPRDTWAEDVTLRSACGVCVNGADALTRTADNWSRAAADEPSSDLLAMFASRRAERQQGFDAFAAKWERISAEEEAAAPKKKSKKRR